MQTSNVENSEALKFARGGDKTARRFYPMVADPALWRLAPHRPEIFGNMSPTKRKSARISGPVGVGMIDGQ